MDKSMLDKNNVNQETEVEEIKVGPDVDIEVEPGVVIEEHAQRVVISKDVEEETDNDKQPVQEQSMSKVDLNKVHEMESKASDAIEKGLGAVMGAVQGAFDTVTQGINNTVDKVENTQGQTYNQYGQPMGAEPQNFNQNQYGQQGHYQNNQGQQINQNVNLNKNTFQQGFIADPNRADNVTPDKMKLEPALAAIISFFVSGLGQMINGQLEKGLIILGCGLIVIPILAVITCGLGAFLAIPFAIFQIIDAYKCAQILQSGRLLGKYEYHLW